MRELKASTKAGQRVIEMGERCVYDELYNIYDRWSYAKEQAFRRCREMFLNSDNSTAFGIGNANSFGFTASWLDVIDNEHVMRVETKDNSYLVWLDR